jgi:hypothetical protein
VTLFLLAYFLRFESDLVIAAAFCGFAAVLLGLIHQAGRRGWRVHEAGRVPVTLEWFETRGLPLKRIPELALWVMGASLLAYAATVVLESGRVGPDVTALCLLLLTLLLVSSAPQIRGSGRWLERAAAYVSVVLLVYLDQTSPERSNLLSGSSWMLLGITGVAAVVRFWLSPTRRFEVTSLDVLVVFIALVIPNLPGSVELPPDLPAGIAKAVILLYVIEMLLGMNLKRTVPRACLVVMLGAIAARGLFALNL